MQALIFIIFTAVSYCRANQPCCKQHPLNNNGTCSDGTPIELDCESVYVLNVNETGIVYAFDDTGTLIINDVERIPPGDYCSSKMGPNNEDVFMFCVQEEPLVEQARMAVNTTLQFVSVFFILVTILVYISVPEMQDLQGYIVMHTISGLAIAFSLLGFLQISNKLDNTLCHMVAYSMYFAFLFAFFWLNVLCFHIWKQVIQPTFIRNIHNWRMVYTAYGIGGPISFTLFVMLIDNAEITTLGIIHPRIAIDKCWFRSIKETFIYLYGPIGILILANIFYFTWTAIVLWQRYNENRKMKNLRYRLELYSRLFFIMGITWIFEVISAALDGDQSFIKFVWLISDALNALEGLIIFLILVVFRKGVLRKLLNRTYCCGYVKLPSRWRKEEEEHDDDTDPVEEELVMLA